jgi:hypothetical protein
MTSGMKKMKTKKYLRYKDLNPRSSKFDKSNYYCLLFDRLQTPILSYVNDNLRMDILWAIDVPVKDISLDMVMLMDDHLNTKPLMEYLKMK